MGAALAMGSINAMKLAAEAAKNIAMDNDEKEQKDQMNNLELQLKRKQDRKKAIEFYS